MVSYLPLRFILKPYGMKAHSTLVTRFLINEWEHIGIKTFGSPFLKHRQEANANAKTQTIAQFVALHGNAKKIKINCQNEVNLFLRYISLHVAWNPDYC